MVEIRHSLNYIVTVIIHIIYIHADNIPPNQFPTLGKCFQRKSHDTTSSLVTISCSLWTCVWWMLLMLCPSPFMPVTSGFLPDGSLGYCIPPLPRQPMILGYKILVCVSRQDYCSFFPPCGSGQGQTLPEAISLLSSLAFPILLLFLPQKFFP